MSDVICVAEVAQLEEHHVAEQPQSVQGSAAHTPEET